MTKFNPFTPPPQTTLPIIQRLIVVYKIWHEIVPNFPKRSKYTLGNRIDSLFVDALELIFIASYLPRDSKTPYIQKAIGKIDLIKFFLQIVWEINSLEDKKYITISEPLTEVGRMLGGWYRQLISKTSAR